MRVKLFFIVFLLPIVIYGQVDRVALFNEERTMDRRFTLYRGQFRANATYDLSTFKSEFDTDGNKTLLSENGVSSNRHSFTARFRYGIIDYLDLEYKLNYQLQNYRGEPVYIVAPPAPSLQVYTDIVTKGLSDMYLGFNGRLPIPSRKIDIGGSFGLYLPTADSQPDMPEHTYSTDDLGDVINYYYLENWGYGVSSMSYQGFIKYRLENFALSASFQSRVPMGETEGLIWSSKKNDDNSFTYMQETYQYQNPQTLYINALAEYQLYQWVNAYLEFTNYSAINGWSEETGAKIAIPDAKQLVISPGFEVLISSKLWLRQKVSFPLSGKNMYSQFHIQTSFLYNVFLNK